MVIIIILILTIILIIVQLLKMGGGNAQKTAMSRAKNQAKADSAKNAGGGVFNIILSLLLDSLSKLTSLS